MIFLNLADLFGFLGDIIYLEYLSFAQPPPLSVKLERDINRFGGNGFSIFSSAHLGQIDRGGALIECCASNIPCIVHS